MREISREKERKIGGEEMEERGRRVIDVEEEKEGEGETKVNLTEKDFLTTY